MTFVARCTPFAFVALAACAPSQDVAMPEPAEGALLFAQNCAICHGANGQGGSTGTDGPPPADLTRLALANGGVFPREMVLTTVDGYNRQALGDQRMPEFGGFLGGETVPLDVSGTASAEDANLTPVPRALAALVAYLETLQVK